MTDSQLDPDSAFDEPTVERKWFLFGVVIGVAHLGFLALILVLVQIDLMLGLVVAVTLSVLSGIGITVFALWWRE
ncbi:hypothetical protein [Natronorubrum daqingense]|uniref:Uncharacterized protein n=1 Tax=Natronorubrum daqingense TaxID=588898 RepID=A0A1N6YML9_9EURY|nr:hypothetical protein [Natronorubrum daqingense]APX95618.1 hypothetical protein BB347_02750 [Natronorubrum daqingense]SIR15796.1 hypothetical protein SAMN05421809_0496 [Natronorubrum daqingense]